MLKPFYNKKKNIDNRLLPSATAADAGKVVGVDDEGRYVLTEGGGGGADNISSVKGKFNIIGNSTLGLVDVPAKTFWHDFYGGSLLYIPESFQIRPDTPVEVDVFVIAQKPDGVLFSDESPFVREDDDSGLALTFTSGTGIEIIRHEDSSTVRVFFNGFYGNFTVVVK